MKTRFITPQDFKEYTGIDLSYELVDDDNAGNKAEAFLTRIQVRLETYLECCFFKKIDFDELTDYQKEHYKYALLEQALYVFKNGDIGVDSGYDQERGLVVDRSKTRELQVSDLARQHLILAGLWDRKIRGANNGIRLY